MELVLLSICCEGADLCLMDKLTDFDGRGKVWLKLHTLDYRESMSVAIKTDYAEDPGVHLEFPRENWS